MKLGSARSDIYAIQQLDGTVELNVPGYVWKLPNEDGYVEFYFERYPHIGYTVNWLERYNATAEVKFTVLARLRAHLGGVEEFRNFKRKWARENCPKLLKSHFKVMQAAPLNGWNSIIKNAR